MSSGDKGKHVSTHFATSFVSVPESGAQEHRAAKCRRNLEESVDVGGTPKRLPARWHRCRYAAVSPFVISK